MNGLVLDKLLRLAVDDSAADGVRAIAHDAIATLDEWLAPRIARESDPAWRAHYRLARSRIALLADDPASIRALPEVTVPPGSPIGAAGADY